MLALLAFVTLVSKQAFEARRRQLGVTHSVLDRFVAEITLNRAGIDAVVRQLVAAGVPEHVRVHLELEACNLAGTFDHGLEAAIGERCPALADEDEW